MKTIVLVALLAAAGCSKKTSECDASIAKGMSNFTQAIKNHAPSPQMQESMMHLVGKLQGALVERCSQDKWSPEALSCFTTITSRRAMEACNDKLTMEQRTKLTADLAQVIPSSRMPPGLAGHPSMLTGSGGPGGPGATPGSPDGSGAAPAGSAAPAGGAAAPATGGSSAPATGGSAAAAPAGSAAPAPVAGSNAK